MRFGQAMLYVFLGLLIMAIAVSVGVNLLGAPRLTANLLMSVIWVLAGAAVPITICALAMDRGGRAWLGWSGIIAMAVAVPMWIWLIAMYETLPVAGQIVLPVSATLFSSWSLFAGVASGMLIMPLEGRFQRWVRNGTICAMIMTALIGNLALANAVILHYVRTEDLPIGSWYLVDSQLLPQWFGVGVTLVGVGAFMLMLLHYERKLRGQTLRAGEQLAFNINCPRCGMGQQLHTEGDACTGCGLKVKVTVV